MKIKVVNNQKDGVPEIAIRGEITDDMANEVADAIANVKGNKLRLVVNSLGGSVQAAFTMLSAMANYMKGGGTVETQNTGRADSAASWLVSAGTRGERSAYDFAGFYLHPPMLEDGRTIDDFDEGDPIRNKLVDYFDKLVNIFTNVTGIGASKIRDLMRKERDLTANEAANIGLIDKVLVVENKPVFNSSASRLEIMNAASSIQFKIKKDTNMSVINKRLNLIAEANEQAQLKAIDAIMNERDEAKTVNSKLAAENKELKAQIRVINEEKEAALVKNASDYVDQYIAKNPNSKEHKDVLVNWAKADLDAFKATHPLKAEAIKNESIDGGMQEEGNDSEAKEKEEADKFNKLSIDERNAIKNSNIKEYRRLSALRAKHIFGVQ